MTAEEIRTWVAYNAWANHRLLEACRSVNADDFAKDLRTSHESLRGTLLHIIGMHDSEWTGEYYFGGHAVHRLSPKDRAKLHKQYIGFVFQSYHLLDHLTVYENLEVPLSYRDVKKSERDSIVCDVLDMRTVRPLDIGSIIESLKRTGRIVVVDQCWPYASVASEAAIPAEPMPLSRRNDLRVVVAMAMIPTPLPTRQVAWTRRI